MSDTISYSQCGTDIEIAEVLSTQREKKLRAEEAAKAKEQIAILVRTELAKDVSSFRHIVGFWVTSAACAISLASVLRAGLIEVVTAKKSLQGRNVKMEYRYSYLSGPEFRHCFEGIVEAFVTLRAELRTRETLHTTNIGGNARSHWSKPSLRPPECTAT